MADTLLRTFMGFCLCSHTVEITQFLTCCTFIGPFSLAQWILIHCSDIWILSASALMRRPSAGLLAWTLCRPLLLNFWTFLWTHTWPSKRNIQLTKDLRLPIGQHSRPRPCGNRDKTVEDGSKLPTNRTGSRHKFFLICAMSSIWMCITTQADLKLRSIGYRFTILPLFDGFLLKNQRVNFWPWSLILHSIYLLKGIDYIIFILCQIKIWHIAVVIC